MDRIIEEKREIRLQMSSLKKKTTEKQKAEEAEIVFKQIEAQLEFQNAKSILMYWSTEDELPTHKFVEKWREEKIILLPSVVENDIQLKVYTTSSDLMLGNLGIWEPAIKEIFHGKIDLAIVPGIAFDRNKNRLGRGKGFYDRYFENLEVTKWGVGFSFQFLETIPNNLNDKVMDKVFVANKIVE